MAAPSQAHPSTSSSSKEIDYTTWAPPTADDARSPCPMLNALANHSILPHSGRSISKAAVIAALHDAVNLDPSIGKMFASVAVTTNPEHSGLGQLLRERDDWTFDLDTLGVHGTIEHDVSLSRQDFRLGGDAVTFNENVWAAVVAHYQGREKTDFHTASKARYERFQKAKQDHEAAGQAIEYGVKEAFLSYGETALWMALLGDPKDGEIPVKYLKTLFEEERLPYNEGWRKNEKPVTQPDMNHLLLKLVGANEHKLQEAQQIGLGSIHQFTTAITETIPHYCTIM